MSTGEHKTRVLEMMPKVAALVDKYGSSVIGSCLNKIKKEERRVGRIQSLRDEITDLEDDIEKEQAKP